MKTLREELHSLMVAVMQGDRDEAYRIKQDLTKFLERGFKPDIWRFMDTLVEVMEIWGQELEKARRLREALKLFLDDELKAYHIDEEGITGEEEVFYKYYHRDSSL
jgi:hypothetical protein